MPAEWVLLVYADNLHTGVWNRNMALVLHQRFSQINLIGRIK